LPLWARSVAGPQNKTKRCYSGCEPKQNSRETVVVRQDGGAARLLAGATNAQHLPNALPCVHRTQDDLKKPNAFESSAFEALESNFQEVGP
jgi:hypothetical protein